MDMCLTELHLRKRLGLVFLAVQALWCPFVKVLFARGRCKRVLLVAETDLMAAYLDVACDLIRHDLRVMVMLTAPPDQHGRFRVPRQQLRRRAEDMNLPWIPFWRARLQWWDLILFANHTFAGRFYRGSNKVLVNHGITHGKALDGQDWRYGRFAYRHRDRKELQFVRIFEANEASRREAIKIDPRFGACVRVVGDRRADRMLELVPDRERIRKEMGFRPDDLVVLIVSTWGPFSLMETMGPALVEQARALQGAGKYRFILSSHPLHWRGLYAETHPWGEFIQAQEKHGFVIVSNASPWEPFAVAADLAVTDHTSVSGYFSLLNKPMVFIQLGDGAIVRDSWDWRLYQLSIRLDSPERLEQALQEATTHYPINELRQLAFELNSCPGESAARMRDELYGVLHIPIPS